jgi:Protein of unknown function (DUF2938)
MIDNDFLWRSLIIGIAGTAAMDLWAIVLHRVFAQPLPNWGLVGRWFLLIPQGKIFHDDIAFAPAFSYELTAGWIAHYGTGIVYGGALIAIMGHDYALAPTLLPALILAWITVGAGWFILQPGMGAGWAASKRDKPWTIRAMNLVAHTWFGLGMWLGAMAVA